MEFNRVIEIVCIVFLIGMSLSGFGQVITDGTPSKPQTDSTKISEESKHSIVNYEIPNDTSKEEGIIKYEVTIDENGRIINIALLECTVSEKVETKYRENLRKGRYPSDNSISKSKVTKGKVTYNIKSR